MSALHVLAALALAAGVLVVLISAVGVMVMRDPYQRLQFVSPAATVGAGAIVVAMALGGAGPGAMGKAALILLLLAFQNGVVAHATARAAFVRARKCWPPPPDELEPVAEEEP